MSSDQPPSQESNSADLAALIDTIRAEGRANRREEQSEDRAKRLREWITIVLLTATVVAVGWQVSEMIRVYGPIRDQAQAEQKVADAAKVQSIAATKQSANSDKAAEEAQRAWVGPDAATIDATPNLGKPVVVSITYHNTGREPARSFVFSAGGTVPTIISDAKGELATQFTGFMTSCFSMPARPNAGVVFPSTGFGGASLTMTFKGEAIDQAVIDNKKMLLVQGCFAYETFNKVHHSAFCYYWRGDVSKSQNMNICESGNNAD